MPVWLKRCRAGGRTLRPACSCLDEESFFERPFELTASPLIASIELAWIACGSTLRPARRDHVRRTPRSFAVADRRTHVSGPANVPHAKLQRHGPRAEAERRGACYVRAAFSGARGCQAACRRPY